MPESRRVRALIVASTLAILIATTSVSYTVESGDTLGRIARAHDVSISELVDANDIANPDLVYPGQILLIPGEVPVGSNDDGEFDQAHIVLRGETLSRIADRYGTSAISLAQANSLTNPNLIFPGQQLLVPRTLTTGGSPDVAPDPGDTETPTPVSTESRSGRFHIVARGESIASIADQYSGVLQADIIEANGIVEGAIYSGTRLFLDGPGYVASGTEGLFPYTVERGDRLADIASRYSTTVSILAEINQIAEVNLIRIGQTIQIPSGPVWVCPVDGGTFFNDWGFPRGGGARYHDGNDIFAPLGTVVRAPVSGVVVFKTGSMGGYQFNLEGDDGVMYLGSHMDRFEGSERRVIGGDVLGYLGNSGNAIGSRYHLHFAMYLGGLSVNPYPSLVANDCK